MRNKPVKQYVSLDAEANFAFKYDESIDLKEKVGLYSNIKENYLAALTKMQKMIIMSTVLGANNNKLLEVPAIKKEL